MTKRGFLKLLALIALVSLPSSAFAAVDLPAIANAYGKIVEGLLTQVVVGLVILVMLISAGWQMYENGNARPLKWAIGASIVMAGAVYFGESIIDYAAQTLNSFKDGDSVHKLTTTT
jgi:chromate transport protein ChrA